MLSDEYFDQIRAQGQEIDSWPEEWRLLVYEHGYAIVESMRFFGKSCAEAAAEINDIRKSSLEDKLAELLEKERSVVAALKDSGYQKEID